MEKVMVMVAVVATAVAAGVGWRSEAAVYKVGDAAGWTILGSPNYTAWAVTKNIHLGDTIVFVYNKNFHNVLEVSKENYKACNAASPIATYTTGNDSVTLNRRGHHFFLCGVPGHCAAGQKVDIRIAKPHAVSAAAPAASTKASPVPASAGAGGGAVVGSGSAPAPDPRHSAADPKGCALAPEMLFRLSAMSAALILMQS
ncbi:mavicyanin-like [Zingiber officinale]|uniref:mavicyanin-like n=1 Tax=Zingiber officinale TaxID=94328 RepID=UPI001C4D14A2|nr:mavicyanin-like [Zingiber officinale]